MVDWSQDSGNEELGGAKETELPIFETLLKVGSITTRGLSPIAKKEAHARASFRRCQRVSNDSHTGRLQLLFHQTTSIATLRLDGPTNAGLPTDHVIGQVPQSAFQALHRFVRHTTHPQRRAQHLCLVEEIAFQRGLVY